MGSDGMLLSTWVCAPPAASADDIHQVRRKAGAVETDAKLHKTKVLVARDELPSSSRVVKLVPIQSFGYLYTSVKLTILFALTMV